MPKTVLGKPVDEEAWQEAKKQAAKEGQAGNYAYIMSIYKQMAHLGKAADYRDSVTLTIECNRAAADELLPLLKELKTLGNIGASRSIVIEDWDGKSSFGFDGDGPSTIESIKQGGELVKAKHRLVLKRIV